MLIKLIIIIIIYLSCIIFFCVWHVVVRHDPRATTVASCIEFTSVPHFPPFFSLHRRTEDRRLNHCHYPSIKYSSVNCVKCESTHPLPFTGWCWCWESAGDFAALFACTFPPRRLWLWLRLRNGMAWVLVWKIVILIFVFIDICLAAFVDIFE